MDIEELLADELTKLTGQAWQLEHTGGGCTALVLELLAGSEWGHYFMVTDEGASVPQANEPCHLGEYVGVNDLNHWYFENRRELVAFLSTWFEDRDTE
jgi:hypothetical protein